MSATRPVLVQARQEEKVLVLTPMEPHIEGDETAEAFLNDLANPLPEAAPLVVVDFQHVKTITAAGLRAMLNFRRLIRQRGGQLVVCGLSEAVADVFFTSHLVSTTASSVIPFAMAPSLAAAVAHLNRNAGT